MAKRHVWTNTQENYLESLFETWHSEFAKQGKIRKSVRVCPVDHKHATRRGYCLLSERQWTITYVRRMFGWTSDEVSDRSIWTKYGRVNGLRENGKVKREKRPVADSYTSPSSSVSLVSGFGTQESKDNWARWLEAAGCTFLGNGVSRHVFDLGDGNVLKVSSHAYGTDNADEVRLWNDVQGTKYEKYFAPIVAADTEGRWIVMKKAKTYPHYENRLAEEAVRQVQPASKHYGLFDIHYGNVGELNGRPVMVDYAR